MIRILLGAALPLAGLGLAASLAGSELLTGPRGEPLRVAAPDSGFVQKAHFDSRGCASHLRYDLTPAVTAEQDGAPRLHVFAFDLDAPDDSGNTAHDTEKVILIFDQSGQLVAAKRIAEGAETSSAEAVLTHCAPNRPRQGIDGNI